MVISTQLSLLKNYEPYCLMVFMFPDVTFCQQLLSSDSAYSSSLVFQLSDSAQNYEIAEENFYFQPEVAKLLRLDHNFFFIGRDSNSVCV